ncbi:DUF72 domain-containing protein [Solibacillus merdavium]|uniref:DUF72 domain-containing protein n=1 Tax=Solibacillus merdavium TaxID=2762218 RepID=A0ABR8XMV9_9BACL|nr:DUF72 domain-containing protein [Solibacillus merdavium]MBD8033272.1 DUF72 domain-containing protein [Solibacillus merdavium]
MISIGLTGWGDHPDVYSKVTVAKDKLFDYSGHFPVVELDTSFYAIPSIENVKKWCKDTPDNFQFVIKAYQGMTGHLRDELPFETKNDMFNAFRSCADTFKKHGKLAMVLVQFPPWFDCQRKNVQYIRYIKQQLTDYPIAIEFRNQTWYSPQTKEKTLQFLKEHQFIHTVCDEPQAGSGSVPFVPVATNNEVLLRIHGRNVHGWRNIGHGENWRKVRFLYDYNEEELQKLAEDIQLLETQVEHIYVLFNNNSGGHAAKNAKRLQQILRIEFGGLAPKQLGFFEE